MAHRFEALQEPLTRLRTFRATAVAQPITRWYVTPLDRCARFATRTVQPRPCVVSAWARRRNRLDVRLMVVGHDVCFCIMPHIYRGKASFVAQSTDQVVAVVCELVGAPLGMLVRGGICLVSTPRCRRINACWS